MSREYTHIQELLPCILAMKGKGYTYRQIADQLGLKKEQVEELCKRERRKEREIARGHIPQPKGQPRKMSATQDDLDNKKRPNILSKFSETNLFKIFLTGARKHGLPPDKRCHFGVGNVKELPVQRMLWILAVSVSVGLASV